MTGKVRHDHPSTSFVAADEFSEDRLNRLQTDMLSWFREHKHGTDAEIATSLGWNETTARVRRIELVEKGYLIDSGKKRLNANNRWMIVWVLAAVQDEELCFGQTAA